VGERHKKMDNHTGEMIAGAISEVDMRLEELIRIFENIALSIRGIEKNTEWIGGRLEKSVNAIRGDLGTIYGALENIDAKTKENDYEM